jgi:hypothetical protein
MFIVDARVQKHIPLTADELVGLREIVGNADLWRADDICFDIALERPDEEAARKLLADLSAWAGKNGCGFNGHFRAKANLTNQ